MLQLGVSLGITFAALAILIYAASCVRIVDEYERGVLFFQGHYQGVVSPGIHVVFHPFSRLVIVDLRTLGRDVRSEDVVTLDKVSCTIEAVVAFRVVDPARWSSPWRTTFARSRG